jgi:hypothetical protein
MTAAEALANIGRALYGEGFTAALSEGLGMGIRPLQRMIAGTKPVPPGVARDALALFETRATEIRAALGIAEGSQHDARTAGNVAGEHLSST